MNKNEQIKMKVFFIFYIVFVILTIIGTFMVITERAANAGYSVIPTLFALLFGSFYRNSKKAIYENK